MSGRRIHLACGLLLLLTTPVWSQTSLKVESNTYTSSRVCGQCHGAIYDKWKNSMHAMSLEDPVFQTAYVKAVVDYGGPATRLCLRCHAPTVQYTKDWELAQEVTREGITCDFCHTISGVDLTNAAKPYTITIGKVKRGPLKGATPTVHHAENSDLHTRSEFCAGCHEFTGPGGALLFGTYSEWKDSPYAQEGKHCQNCHMPVTTAPAVRREVQEQTARANLHDLQGGHSEEQVRKAAEVEILALNRKGDHLDVEVAVTNVGSGHMIPTGMPSRALILEIVASDKNGRTLGQFRTVFKKVLADSTGKTLLGDQEILFRAAEVVSDNRIAPREKRLVVSTLNVPRSAAVTVEAKLFYSYSPLVPVPQEMLIEMGASRKTLASR